MNSGIYRIYNISTSKFYIGSAVNLQKRLSNHKWALKCNRHNNKKLQNAYNKYGKDKFTFEVIETCFRDSLLAREQFYLDVFQCVDFGYNLLKTAGSPLGNKVSEETKRKMSISAKNMSEETKRRMSQSRMGRVVSVETRKKISMSNTGICKPHTEETKKKMSLTRQKCGTYKPVKPFKIVSPSGNVVEGVNLKQFCRENNLIRVTWYK